MTATIQTGTTYTLAATDKDSIIRFTNAALVTVTIPTDAVLDLPNGYQAVLYSEGAAGLTIDTTGITLVDSSSVTTIKEGEAVFLEKTPDANTWFVLGSVEATFTSAYETKLNNIEALADVTDAINVAAAGASMVSSGSGAPGTTPAGVGYIYIDTTGDRAYVSTATSSSADWDLLPVTATEIKALLGVTGDVVGTTDVQTITNKTILGITNDIDANRLTVVVRNDSGSTLTKGTPVYVSGYNVGLDIILVDTADATSISTADTLGLVAEDIDNNNTGYLIMQGDLNNVDTSAFSAGDRLYLSETAGQLTATRPTGTAVVQSIGEVLRSHASQGVIAIERSQSYKTGLASLLMLDGTTSAMRTRLGLAIGSDVQAHSSILDNTTASFTTDYETKLSNIEALADITDATNVDAAGAVMESDYDANTILAATSDNTPAALTVAEQTLIGRITSGNIAALTATQIRTLLNIENGATADQIWGEITGTLSNQTDVQSALDALQPLDSDLTAIAALTTTAYGRALLTLADQAALQVAVNVEDGATADQTASEVPVVDTGANYAGSDVEAVLAEIATTLSGLVNGMVFQGAFDASGGSFPAGANTGDYYRVTVSGTIDSVTFDIGDALVAITDSASTSTYVGNWQKLDNTDAVTSVAGLVGTITASALRTALNVEDGATADQTAADIRGLGFFDTTNDGAGSGLDADTLDGDHASAFIKPANTPSDLAADVSTTQSGTTYQIDSDDDGTLVRFTNAAAVTVTVPTDASDDLRDGYKVVLFAEGAGGILLDLTGITLAVVGVATTAAQGEVIVLEKTSAANTWIVLAPADLSSFYSAGGTDVAIADGGTGASDATTALTNLGAQPLDSDLTAIAGLSTTAYGRALLTLADQTALQAAVNVEDGATADQTAADIRGLGFFDTTNDGAGSGLDADTLDGDHASAFIKPANSPSDLTPDVSTTQAGTTYQIDSDDDGSMIRFTSASAVTVTIPTDATDDLRDGYRVALLAEGAGGITLSTTGVTLAPTGTPTTASQGQVIVAEKTADANTWIVLGPTDLSSHYYSGGTDVAIADGGTGASTAADARTNLGVDPAGTDNSTDVTLAGTPDYITIAGQVITRNQIDLTTDVTGDLPVAEGGTGASDASGARTNLGLVIGTDVQAYDADTLKADTSDTLTAGFDSDDYALGTISSGTVTPAASNGENFITYTNNGAHTLAPPTNSGVFVIQVTNAASAGAITTSGFTLVDGDAYATTNTNVYLFVVTKVGTSSVLTIKDLN